ncbi:unnamed protein product [Caenorhabditis angaria]|uniref:OBG-type G domain-containing protein n=1 Tax=Caenorhabditis angaria TaxID=860376 RepID=A0A9P1N3S3_9PELO|nr:unnamed protein product [Caenorhabditis angaria]
MGILEKIAEIEHEISRTQKNKATEYHLGLLKAKLAKYRQQLLEPTGKGGAKGEGFDVMKSGDARVAMVGFPSVGKSTLLSSMTTTHSEAAGYEFTTLTCIPGVISYNGANIQLLDLPGIIEGASQGKGRGRQVISVAKTADLILMMLDAGKSDQQKMLLERELESVGIRLNKKPPNIYVKQKKVGGVKFTNTVPLTHCNEKLIMTVLHEYKIFNADVIFREDCTIDEFIDIIQGNRVYMTCLYVYNKIDQISIEEIDRLARKPHHVVISCEMNLNMDYLLEKMWEYLALVRCYTKKPGNAPDLGPEDGIILRSGATVEHCCHALHRSLAAQLRYAIVWGTSTKFSPQRVGLHHKLDHEDVIQIMILRLLMLVVISSSAKIEGAKKKEEKFFATYGDPECDYDVPYISTNPLGPNIECQFLPDNFLDCQQPQAISQNLQTNSNGSVNSNGKLPGECLKMGGARIEDVEFTDVICQVLYCIPCRGERQFLRKTPCIKYTGHYFLSTLLYSVLLGVAGVDRFCLGYSAMAVGKMMTLGGFGIWWLVDIFLLIFGILLPADDSNWEPYY